MGGRFMLINHIGRKSGQVRQVVVEVIKHDQTAGTFYVASGWGFKSQWFQNIQATPNVQIQVGWQKYDVHAEVLSPASGAAIIIDYRQHHRFAAKQLGKSMGLNMADASEDELVEMVKEHLPIIAFRPRAADL